MEQLYYYNSIRKTIVQTLDLFNDINIAKYDKAGSIVKLIKVPIKLAPKEKFLTWIYNQKSFERRLPMMGLSMTGLAYDPSRMTNDVTPITYMVDGEFMKHVTPVPYNINFKLNIATQYIVEMDQVLEQILPFFSPYVEIRIPLPEFNNSYNVKVILQSASQTSTIDKNQDEYRIVTWELDFVAHAFLLKPTRDTKLIHKIIERYYNNQDSWNSMRSLEPSATDTLPLSANGDFDAATVYMEGIMQDGQISIIKHEEYEGN